MKCKHRLLAAAVLFISGLSTATSGYAQSASSLTVKDGAGNSQTLGTGLAGGKQFYGFYAVGADGSILLSATAALQQATIAALGTPYQAGGALPLPSGAATSALQTALNTSATTIASNTAATINALNSVVTNTSKPVASVTTGTLSAVGAGTSAAVRGDFNVTLSGTFTGNVGIERSFNGGTTWFPLTVLGSAISLTKPASEIFSEPEAGVIYHIVCTSLSSGSITYRISQ